MQNDSKPVIVIFGISGDLSKRKLLPALYDLLSSGILPSETKVIGTSRRSLSATDILDSVDVTAFSEDKADPNQAKQYLEGFLEILQLDPDEDSDYQKLEEKLNQLDKDAKRLRLYYMSIPSSAYEPIIKKLAEHNLNDQRSRLMIEKPFGHDLNSAIESIEVAHNAFKEEQIYRIDHYLAKDMSQNLVSFRNQNKLYSQLWNKDSIDSVLITQHETLGIEGRADFYEQTGALRDVVQNHLMQLLTVTLMDEPSDFTSAALHKSKLAFLNSLNPADPNQAVRKQYKNYKEEVDNPTSQVETFARIVLTSNLDKWDGVKFILEHGKAMPESFASVTINFKQRANGDKEQLVFSIQPEEKITQTLQVKVPGLDDEVKESAMNLDFHKAFPERKSYDAYEKVIFDSILGDQSLFASDDEVIASWKVVQPIIEAWQKDNAPISTY